MQNSLEPPKTYVAFEGSQLLASGSLEEVLTRVHSASQADSIQTLLIFEQESGEQVDFNLQGPLATVLERACPKAPAPGPGRPKLGVLNREVGLLPRHWEWLDQQAQSASATLRRLVEEARRREPNRAQARRVREAVGRVMGALAGDLPAFEEACRALYAADLDRFKNLVDAWPEDIRSYLVARFAAAKVLDEGISGAD